MLAGYVCLMGAGPGDPGLITRQGLAYLKRADAVLYDHLVPVELLLEVRSGCELINVGKQCGQPSWNQEAIQELLIAKARSGKFVVRLKGGDPFLFGRGGEEARALAAAQVPYLVVPGISAALSVPAAAGIPVTDRQFAPGLTISTGHRADDPAADLPDTQVVLMSLTNLAEITAQLLDRGYSGATPAALISRGTTPFQKRVVATLATIEAAVAETQLPAPALFIAGAVVELAEVMDWQRYLPLYGRRILWTRPDSTDDQRLLEDLQLLGARIVRLPTFEIQPIDRAKLITMLPQMRRHSWIVFTSSRAVEIFFDGLAAAGQDWRYFEASKFAVVGQKTAATLQSHGRVPELIAKEASSAGLWKTLQSQLQSCDRVALCRAETALPHIANGLAGAGIEFAEFKLYRNQCPVYPPDIIARVFADPFDVVVFTAPLAVKHYFQIWREHPVRREKEALYACLGKETASELEKEGRRAWVVPPRPFTAELVKSILAKWEVNGDVSSHASAQVAPDSPVTDALRRV